MKKTIILLQIILVSIAVFSCSKEKKTKAIVTENEYKFRKDGELKIYINNGQQYIKMDIEIADDDYERETGLMYRDSLPMKKGMLFIFPDEEYRNFYMKNTKIPLDIIYINKDKVITQVISNTIPFNENGIPSDQPAKYVLEVNATISSQWELTPGLQLDWIKK